MVRNLPAMQETWVGKIPWRREWQPIPVLWPGEVHGQRSLGGYSPWGHKESDTTEQLSLSLWAFLVGQLVKNPPAMQETPVRFLGREDPLEEGIGYPLQYSWASLVAQLVKNLPAMRETWVGKIPWRRERLPTPVFWPRVFRGLYSPWGCKESDTTERLHFHL